MATHNANQPQRDIDKGKVEAEQKQLVMYKSVAEYEKKIAQLSQDNFDLRLYCYNLEEKIKKMGCGNNAGNSCDVREMSKLEAQVRSLQESVERKANLLLQGSAALDQVRQELEAAVAEKHQLCCAIKQRDCQIQQLSADNKVLCNAVCQLQHQLRCMEQRCQTSNARLLELDELVRRRDCELADARVHLRECSECLQQMVLAEEQRQATSSEALQTKLSEAEAEIERLRAENANLLSQLEVIPQLQQDVELLEQEDGELRESLKAEQRKSDDMRLLYEKQLDAMRAEIDELKDEPSSLRQSLVEGSPSEDDSGQESPIASPASLEASSPTRDLDSSEHLSESQASNTLNEWQDFCEERFKKLEKLQKSGQLRGAKLNDYLEELTRLMQKKFVPLFRRILRNIDQDDDERLLNRMQGIADACADELNILFDSARDPNNQMTRRESQRFSALSKEATEAHALLRDLVQEAARKWRRDDTSKTADSAVSGVARSKPDDAASVDGNYAQTDEDIVQTQQFSGAQASSTLYQWHEICEQRFKNLKLQQSSELHGAKLDDHLKELTRMMQNKLAPLFRRILEDIAEDEDGRLLKRMQCITDACSDELNILLDSAKNKDGEPTTNESQQRSALAKEAAEAHAVLRALVEDAARKWRKEASSKPLVAAVPGTSVEDKKTIIPGSLTDENMKRFIELLESNPPIDQMLQIMNRLKQALAEQRKAIGTPEELHLAFEKIALLVQALNKSLQRAQIEMKKAVDSNKGKLDAEEREKLEALIELLKEILEEFNKQLRQMSEKSLKNNDGDVDLVDSIKKFFAELDESNGTILADINTLDRVGDVNRRQEMWKRIFEHFSNQQQWIGQRLNQLEKSIESRYQAGFRLPSSLQAHANDIYANMEKIRKIYHEQTDNLSKTNDTGSGNNSTGDVTADAARNITTFRRLFIRRDSREISADLQEFFTQLSSYINAVQSALSQTSYAEQNKASLDTSKHADYVTSLLDRFSELQNFLRRKTALLHQETGKEETAAIRRNQDRLREVLKNLHDITEQFGNAVKDTIQTILFDSKPERQTNMARISWLLEEAHVNNQMLEALFIKEAVSGRIGLESAAITPTKNSDESARQDLTIGPSSIQDTAASSIAERKVAEGEKAPDFIAPQKMHQTTDQPAPSPRKQDGNKPINSLASTAAPTSAHPVSGTLDSFSSEEQASAKPITLNTLEPPLQPETVRKDTTIKMAAIVPKMERESRHPKSKDIPRYRSTSEPSKRPNTDNEGRNFSPEIISDRASRDPERTVDQVHRKGTALRKSHESHDPVRALKTTSRPVSSYSLSKESSSTPLLASTPKIDFDVSIASESTSTGKSAGDTRRLKSPQYPSRTNLKDATKNKQYSKPKIEFDVNVDAPSFSESSTSSSMLSPKRRGLEGPERGRNDRTYKQPTIDPRRRGRSPLQDSQTSSTEDRHTAKTYEAWVSNEPTVQLKCVALKQSESESFRKLPQPSQSQAAGGSRSGAQSAVIYLSCKESLHAGSSRGSNEVTLLCNPLKNEASEVKDSFSDECSQMSLAVKSELQALLKNLTSLRGSCKSGGSHEFSGRDISSLMCKIKQVLRNDGCDTTAGTDHSFKSPSSLRDTSENSMQCQWQPTNSDAGSSLPSLSQSRSHNQYTLKCVPYKFSNANHVAQIGQLTREHHNVEYFLGPDEQLGDACCRQDECSRLFAQAAAEQPPNLRSATSDAEAEKLTQTQTMRTQWTPNNLTSINVNIQRAVWLLKEINAESAEILKPLNAQSGASMKADEFLRILQHFSNRLGYLLSSLNQLGESLPSLALNFKSEPLDECDTLLKELLKSHNEHMDAIMTKLQGFRKKLTILKLASIDAMINEVQGLLSRLKKFLIGSPCLSEQKSECQDAPTRPIECLLRDLSKRIEMVSDCFGQLKSYELTSVDPPEYMDKLHATLNQNALFHEFLRRWLQELRLRILHKDEAPTSSLKATLNNFISKIISLRTELKLLKNFSASCLTKKDERKHIKRRISTILDDSKRNIKIFKTLLAGDIQESSTFEILNVQGCKIKDIPSSRKPEDVQATVSNKPGETDTQIEQNSSNKDEPKPEADWPSSTVGEGPTGSLTSADIATAEGVNSSTIKVLGESMVSATEPLSSSQQKLHNKDLLDAPAEASTQLKALLSGLDALQSACETNMQTEFPGTNSLLIGLESLLQDFNDKQKSSCGASNCNVSARMVNASVFKSERRLAELDEERDRSEADPARVQKIGGLIQSIKCMLLVSRRTAQGKGKTKLKQSYPSSSPDALKKLKKSPPRHRCGKRSSRELAKKIAALLRDYSCSAGSGSPGPSNQLSTGSSELSQLVSNVRGLLPKSAGNRRSLGSPSSYNWRRKTRPKRNQKQENQSNACLAVSESDDDDTQCMEISKSSGGGAEFWPSPKEEIKEVDNRSGSRTTWDAQSILSSQPELGLQSQLNAEQQTIEKEADNNSQGQLIPAVLPECSLSKFAFKSSQFYIEWTSKMCSPEQHETKLVPLASGVNEQGEVEADAEIDISASSRGWSASPSDEPDELERILVDKSWLADLGPGEVTTSQRLAAAVAELQNLLAHSGKSQAMVTTH